MAHLYFIWAPLHAHPAEAVISQSATKRNGEAQIDVERHNDEHQWEAEPELNEVKYALQDVVRR